MLKSFTKINFWCYGPGHTWGETESIRAARDSVDSEFHTLTGRDSDRCTFLGETVEIDIPGMMWGDRESAERDIQEMCDTALGALIEVGDAALGEWHTSKGVVCLDEVRVRIARGSQCGKHLRAKAAD